MTWDLQTQSTAATEKIQQSEEQFRLLVEGVQDCAIYMLRLAGLVTTWNSGAQRIKGYEAQEIIGEHFSCFYHPEDIKANKPNASLEAAAAKGKYEEENLRVRKNGWHFGPVY